MQAFMYLMDYEQQLHDSLLALLFSLHKSGGPKIKDKLLGYYSLVKTRLISCSYVHVSTYCSCFTNEVCWYRSHGEVYI